MKFPNKRASALGLLLLLLSLTPAAAAGQAAKKMAKPEASTSERWLPALRTRAEFDSLARVYTDQPYALPHVIFVIDRQDKNKIYYVNSQRYRFHNDFVNGNYLSLERGEEFFKNNYLTRQPPLHPRHARVAGARQALHLRVLGGRPCVGRADQADGGRHQKDLLRRRWPTSRTRSGRSRSRPGYRGSNASRRATSRASRSIRL